MPLNGEAGAMAKGKKLEAGAGALHFTPINDLARGGTISSSIAFRNIPGPNVPPNETPPIYADRRGWFRSSAQWTAKYSGAVYNIVSTTGSGQEQAQC